MAPPLELTSVPPWAVTPLRPPADLTGRHWTVLAIGAAAGAGISAIAGGDAGIGAIVGGAMGGVVGNMKGRRDTY